MSSRIGKGPWARALGAVLVPDDSTPEAIRGEELWRQGAVEDLRIDTGQISARVESCTVKITAPTIPSRVWDAVERYARNRGALEQGVRGEVQSVQLEHLLAQDWDEPLIPLGRDVVQSCQDGRAEHLAAMAYAVAGAIDADPTVLLRWRTASRRQATVDSAGIASDVAEEAWVGAVITDALVAEPVARETVLRRLGPSGIRAADSDLADILASAYALLAGRRDSSSPIL